MTYSDTLWICFDRDDWFGTQNYTCSGCLNHFCYDENCSASFVNWCKICEKGYCPTCVTSNVILAFKGSAMIVKLWCHVNPRAIVRGNSVVNAPRGSYVRIVPSVVCVSLQQEHVKLMVAERLYAVNVR